MMPAPPHLSAGSRRVWKRLTGEYDLTSGQLELLTAALRARDIAEGARATLEKDGYTFLDRRQQPRAHPAATIRRDAAAQYAQILRALGFAESEE